MNHFAPHIHSRFALKLGLCLALWLGAAGLAQGQNASSYTFTATTGTYSALTGTTNTSLGATDDDAISSAITLPFGFTFGGTQYTQIKVSSNGWLTFGTTTNSYQTNSSANASNAKPILFPLWDDLQNIVIPRYVTTGSAPDRIFKLEWPQQEWNYLSGGHVISFQVWLYESSNQIEYIYNRGPDGVNNGSASIGIYDNGGTYLTLNGSGSNPTAQSGTFTTTISTKPANGQIYRFTPPAANYKAYFYAIDFGSTSWCAGETRTVSVTVRNIGTATWNTTYTTNVGVKWNMSGSSWPDYLIRTNTGNLAPGQSGTYYFDVPAFISNGYTILYDSPLPAGTNNLTFDVVNEGNCWFGNNNGSCGPGNTVFTSANLTINSRPSASVAGQTNVSCYAGNNGSITITASGGSGPYYFSIDNGGTYTTNTYPTSYTFSNLTAGDYYPRVKDANGCESASCP